MLSLNLLKDPHVDCQPLELERCPGHLVGLGDLGIEVMFPNQRLVIWLFLQRWTSWLEGHLIQMQSDFAMAVAYINHQGAAINLSVVWILP